MVVKVCCIESEKARSCRSEIGWGESIVGRDRVSREAIGISLAEISTL